MKQWFWLLVGLIVFQSTEAKPHKCEINGKVIFQEAPCDGESQTENSTEPEQRELFDKVFISQLKVIKGKESGEYTPVKFEVPAINNTKNRVQLTLKYEGLNNEGLAIHPITLIGNIDSNSKTVIKSGLLGSQIRTNLLKSIVKWRFNSWKSAIN